MSHLQINQYLNVGLHYMRATFVATESGQQWRACQASRCWPDSHTSEPAIIQGHCRFYPGFIWAEAFAECVHYSNLPHLCWVEFLPGWNPKCAEPGTANDFHALLNLTPVCLQHPVIPSPSNGAEMVPSFHCVTEQRRIATTHKWHWLWINVK